MTTVPDETSSPQDAQLQALLGEALNRPVPCPRCQSTKPCRCYVPADERLAARVAVLLDALRPVLTPPAATVSRLSSFSGDTPRCPKCACMDASTDYHVGQQLVCGRWRDGEHLCRECVRCGYSWAEALAPPPAPADQISGENSRPVTRVRISCHGWEEVLEFPADEATELERVNAELRAAGIEHPPGARGVHDLRGVLSGYAERAEEAERRARRAEDRVAGQRDLLDRWAAEYDRIVALLGDAMKAGRDVTTRELREAIEPLTAIAATARGQEEAGSCSPSS